MVWQKHQKKNNIESQVRIPFECCLLFRVVVAVPLFFAVQVYV